MWHTSITRLFSALEHISVRDSSGNELEPEKGFTLLKTITMKTSRSGNRVYFIGNGASASMASHFAADLTKNGLIPAEVFTDLSLLTAYANDISYDQVFAAPLRLKMRKGDLLVAISSSGNSVNVLNGAETGRVSGGTVVTFSAMAENNTLRTLGDLNFYIPAETYGLAETGHAAILHHWIDMITGEMKRNE